MDGRSIVITGGAGFLGAIHAKAILDAGGLPILLDTDDKALRRVSKQLECGGTDFLALQCDVTSRRSLEVAARRIRREIGSVHGLINNAAIDSKVGGRADPATFTRVETFPIRRWRRELDVVLTGSLLSVQAFAPIIIETASGEGTILNIASDLAQIAPDNRIYEMPGVSQNRQPVKPISYCVAKAALPGFTRYLAAYFAPYGVRVNCLSPGAVFRRHPARFVRLISERIPLGRMAMPHEYGGAVVFLCSGASSYITGANLIADGGRSIW